MIHSLINSQPKQPVLAINKNNDVLIGSVSWNPSKKCFQVNAESEVMYYATHYILIEDLLKLKTNAKVNH